MSVTYGKILGVAMLCTASVALATVPLPKNTVAIVSVPNEQIVAKAIQGTALRNIALQLLSTNNLFSLPEEWDFLQTTNAHSLQLALVPTSTNDVSTLKNCDLVLCVSLTTNEVTLASNFIQTLISDTNSAGKFAVEQFAGKDVVGVPISTAEVGKWMSILPQMPNSEETKTNQIVHFCQTDDTLLLELNKTEGIKSIIDATNGNLPPFEEDPNWQQYKENYQESLCWGWANIAPFVQSWIESDESKASELEKESEGEVPRIVKNLGLESFHNLFFAINAEDCEFQMNCFIESPIETRTGVAALLAMETGSSTTPKALDNIVGKRISFTRSHYDIPAVYDVLCTLVDRIMPDVRDVFANAMLPGIQERFPDFNIRNDFIATLGHDIIRAEYQPSNNSEEIKTLHLIEVQDATAYIANARKIIELIAPIPTKEKNTVGGVITSLPLPSLDLDNAGNPQTNYCHFVPWNKYVAWSFDADFLENAITQMNKVPVSNDNQGGISAGLYQYKNTDSLIRNKCKQLLKMSENEKLPIPVLSLFSPDMVFNIAPVQRFLTEDPKRIDDIANAFAYSIFMAYSKTNGFSLQGVTSLTPAPKKVSVEVKEIEIPEQKEQVKDLPVTNKVEEIEEPIIDIPNPGLIEPEPLK